MTNPTIAITHPLSRIARRARMLLGALAGGFAILMANLIGADTLSITIKNIQSEEGALMLQISSGQAEFAGEQPAIP